tara:strand:+ start:163 stop:1797 length:1635 start_codon:yes stop_codon:yes gene_type:complete
MKRILLSIITITALSFGANAQNVTYFDINSGSANSNAGQFTALADKVYFTADDGTNGKQLWSLDTTTNTTNIILINSTGTSNLHTLTALNGKLYFVADGGTNGYELWKYDPSDSTASELANIHPTGNSYPENLIASNNKLYFSADDGTNGRELWIHNPTANTTAMVSNINPSGDGLLYFSPFIAFNNKLYFAADDGTNGRELWVHNPTANTTSLVANINPTGGSTIATTGYFKYATISYNNKLYFIANDGTNGNEMWVHDPIANTTNMLVDLNPSGDGISNQFHYNFKKEMAVFNGKLYFGATDGTAGGLCEYNPATNSHRWVNGGSGGLSHMAILNNEIYFRGSIPGTMSELLKYSPVDDSVSLVMDFNLTGGNSDPSHLTVINNRLYCRPNILPDGNNGRLFEYDPILNDTISYPNIHPQWLTTPNRFDVIKEIGGKFYFTTTDGGNGNEFGVFTPPAATPLNINEVQNTTLHIYPNPAVSHITIDSDEKIKTITIMDVMAKTVKTFVSSSNSIDVSELTKGIYFLQIQTDKGLISKKFIKK